MSNIPDKKQANQHFQTSKSENMIGKEMGTEGYGGERRERRRKEGEGWGRNCHLWGSRKNYSPKF